MPSLCEERKIGQIIKIEKQDRELSGIDRFIKPITAVVQVLILAPQP
jgi:hypothetical protein